MEVSTLGAGAITVQTSGSSLRHSSPSLHDLGCMLTQMASVTTMVLGGSSAITRVS
jgi:hypothetical protein